MILTASAVFLSLPFTTSKSTFSQLSNYTQNDIVGLNNTSDSFSASTTTSLNSNVNTNVENLSLMQKYENHQERNLTNNSSQIYASIDNTFYGSSTSPSINNPRTSYGVVSTTTYNDGIKFISNSGIVLWEQYFADHPSLSALSSRFNMEIASAAVAENQNALIVLVKTKNSNGKNLFYLIAYDLGTGQPIYDKTATKHNYTIVKEGQLRNTFTDEMSIAYNPINNTVICYTSGRVSEILNNDLAIFLFDATNTAKPFAKRTSSNYLKWSLGNAPNAPRNNDFLIDLAIDNETGLIFAMFQVASGGNTNQKIYIVPFNSNFSSITRATGGWIPIDEVFSTVTDFSPNILFRKDATNTSKGLIYGFYHYKDDSSHRLYSYAIELNTNDISRPSVTTNVTCEKVFSTNNTNTVIKFDENGPIIGCAYLNPSNNTISSKVYNYDYLSKNLDESTSPTGNLGSNFNFTLTNETFDASGKKYVLSWPGYFVQWTKASGLRMTSEFTPTPMVDLNYRSQFLGISNSGSSYYPSGVDDKILTSFSEQVLSDDSSTQKPVDGNGLWAIFKKNATSYQIDKTGVSLSNVIKDDHNGYIQFDIAIPYTDGYGTYVNNIKNLKIIDFKKILDKTALNVNQIDINRYNSVDTVNDDGVPFRNKRPDTKYVSINKIKQMIMFLLVNKPYDMTIDNIIIDESTIVSNYQEGSLTIPRISIDYYYDKNGNLIHNDLVVSNDFKLVGFYQSKETTIDLNQVYYAPRYTTIEEFLRDKNSVNMYLYDSITNVPIEFDVTKDLIYDVNNVTINNKTGVLIINDLKLGKWNNNFGELKTTPSQPYDFAITNFIRIPSETATRSEYTTYSSNIQPSDVTDDEIKQILYETSFNLPENFSVKNITFNSIVRDNLAGTITVEPTFNLWYDEKGMEFTTDKIMGEVVLSGYKAVQPTEINQLWDIGGYSRYPSDYIKDINYNDLKKLIQSNIKNLPYYHLDSDKNFDYLNDILIEDGSLAASNIDGTIKLKFKLKKYYDAKGIFHNDNDFPTTEITITGFKRIFGATSFEGVYNVGLTNISPQDYSDTELKKFLIANAYNIDPNFKQTELTFKSVVRSPINGEIRVVPILTRYYDDNGLPQTVAKEFSEITLRGFKKINPTSFDGDRWILGSYNLVAEEVAKNIPLLKEFLLRKVICAPNNFGANNIVLVSEPFSSNGNGTIQVSFKLTRYYDQDGFLRTDDKSDVFTVIITGFYAAYSKTNINSSISVNYPDIIPQELSNDKLKEILMDNFTNLPPAFTIDNIIMTKNDWSYSNINGTITIQSLKINYYFDQTLKIKNDIYSFPTINISGFRKIQPTILSLSEWDIGNNKIFASEFAKDMTALKQLIATKILNKPLDFDPDADISLTNLQVSNKLGAIKVNVSLKKYYNNLGTLSTYGWTPQSVVITGFAIVNGATSIQTEIDSLSPTVEAISLSDSDIKNILYNNINNPFYGLTPDAISFNRSTDIVVNNAQGEIRVTPTLNMWFDEDGNLNTTPQQFPEVRIYNFKHVEPTSINNFWDYGDINITPEEATKDINTIKTFIFNNINNKPSAFITDNIIISEITPFNTNGRLKIVFTLNKYYDTNGILQTTNFGDVTIYITGYKSIAITSIPSTGWSIGDPNRYASEFLDVNNQNYIKELVYSKVLNLPTNYNYVRNIQLLNVSSNNLLGELEFDVKIKGGYGENGTIDSNGDSNNLNAHIIISGFKPSYQTVVKTNVKIPNVVQFIPETYQNSIGELKKIIFNNRSFIFENLPDNFLLEDIVDISIIDTNNKNGSITIELSIKNYFSEDKGNLVVDSANPLIREIRLTGFHTSQPTIFHDNNPIIIQELGDFLSSKYNEDSSTWTKKWSDIIIRYQYKFFDNLSPYFSVNDINSIIVSNVNDVNGSCQITVSMKNYFMDNENSSLQNDFNNHTFTIKGFKTGLSTSFNNDVIFRFVNYDNNQILINSLLASEIYYNNLPNINLDKLIYQNYNLLFNNLPSNFSINNITSINPISFDNLNGELVVDITINNYFSNIGILINDEITQRFTISGFKKVEPTNNNDINVISSLEQLIATDITNNQLVEIVYNKRHYIFDNTLPECSLDEFKQYFTITNYDATNYNSKILVNAQLGIYYNDSGELIKDINKPLNISFKILGFKQLKNATKIRTNANLVAYDKILITNAINDENFLPSLVISNKDKFFENSPLDLSVNDLEIKINKIDNLTGSINLEIKLDRYYDENSVLIDTKVSNSPSMINTIQVFGFQKIKPTSIGPTEIISIESSTIVITSNIGDPNFDASYYSQINNDDAIIQLQSLVESKLFAGNINNVQNNNITIGNFQFSPESVNSSNNSLVVTFDMSGFISLQEGLIESPIPIVLTITGFGGYQEEIVSKDTIYYITIVAIAYLLILSSGIIGYGIFRVIRWKKGKI